MILVGNLVFNFFVYLKFEILGFICAANTPGYQIWTHKTKHKIQR